MARKCAGCRAGSLRRAVSLTSTALLCWLRHSTSLSYSFNVNAMVLNVRHCNNTNAQLLDQSTFWSDGNINWDHHRIGWAIAGGLTLLTILVTTFSVTKHCLHYNEPLHQRQIIRILLMPPVYAVVSFFSYRFFRDYTYFVLAQSVYEAFAIAAFLFLLVQYIGDTTVEQRKILGSKDKRKIPFPFCCFRYRPSKPYFLSTLKWSVLQYCFNRPLVTIIAMICEAYDKLCPEQYSVHFAEVYLEAYDFIVFSIALYGLVIFYTLTKEQLAGRQPLAKFLTIKGIVFFTFYQGFVFSVLQSRNVIKDTTYWTATNVADGLQALCTTFEMVIFALIMCWSFSWKPYQAMSLKRTNSTRAFLHSQNYSDFIMDSWFAMKFYWDYARRKPGTSSKQHAETQDRPGGLDFGGAWAWNEEEARASYANSMEMSQRQSALPFGPKSPAELQQPTGHIPHSHHIHSHGYQNLQAESGGFYAPAREPGEFHHATR